MAAVCRVLITIILLFLFCVNAWSSKQTYVKRPTGYERPKIIHVLKKEFGKELKKPMKLKLSVYRIQNKWAYLQGTILDKSGKPMDYSHTVYQEAIDQGYFDDWFSALLQKTKGEWHVVIYQIGATDIPDLDWPKRYGAPENIINPKALD
ncbi:MAG: hypothetical protein WAU15_07665 [Nitrosomonas sp.]